MRDFIDSLMYDYEVSKDFKETIIDLEDLLDDAYTKEHYKEVEKEIKKIEESGLTKDEKYVLESFKNIFESKKSRQYFEDDFEDTEIY